jgi:hypothetical protein
VTTATYSALVMAAVDDHKFHTVSGLVAKTGLDSDTVIEVLCANKKLVRISHATDKDENPLYTMRTNRLTFREARTALVQAMGLV